MNKARPVLRFFSKAAIDDDYKQVEIAKYLSISSSAVSKIVLREKSENSCMSSMFAKFNDRPLSPSFSIVECNYYEIF